MKKGCSGAMADDGKHNPTASLFAVLNVLGGSVIALSTAVELGLAA